MASFCSPRSWVNFEAGALSKPLTEGRVATLLVDLTRADATGPLQQFQNTLITDEEDVFKLVKDLAKVPDSEFPQDSSRLAFEGKWQQLVDAVTEGAGAAKPRTRSDAEILEEILDRVRHIESSSNASPSHDVWDVSDIEKTAAYAAVGSAEAAQAGTEQVATMISEASRANPSPWLEEQLIQAQTNVSAATEGLKTARQRVAALSCRDALLRHASRNRPESDVPRVASPN